MDIFHELNEEQNGLENTIYKFDYKKFYKNDILILQKYIKATTNKLLSKIILNTLIRLGIVARPQKHSNLYYYADLVKLIKEENDLKTFQRELKQIIEKLQSKGLKSCFQYFIDISNEEIQDE